MITADDLITSASDIPQAQISDAVASIITRVKSSHEPVFIYNKKNQYQGLTWAYDLLYQQKPSQESIIAPYVKTAPKLRKDSTLKEITTLMISLRLYTLPVFEKGIVIGVVTAKSILNLLTSDNNLLDELTTAMRPTHVITADQNSPLNQVYSTMRKHKLSRVATVNSDNKLIGIVSRRDMHNAIIPPVKRNRHKGKPGAKKGFIYDKKRIEKLNIPLRQLQVTNVVSADENKDLKSILTKIIEKNVSSVVVVDNNNVPLGIYSVRSFLKALKIYLSQEIIPLEISDKNQVLSAFRRIQAKDAVQSNLKKTHAIRKVRRAEIVINPVKSARGNKVHQYEISARVIFTNGNTINTKENGFSLTSVINSSFKNIRSRIEKRR